MIPFMSCLEKTRLKGKRIDQWSLVPGGGEWEPTEETEKEAK